MIERILQLMLSHQLNAKQLTERLELSKSAITDWKKGKAKPSTDAIIKLSDFFDVSTDFLLKGQEKSSPTENLSADEQELLNLFNQLNEKEQGKVLERAEVLLELSKQKSLSVTRSQQKEILKSKFIEIYDLPVSAGKGTYLTGDSKDLCAVKITDATIQASYALKVSGDSMEPLYTDGDVLLVALQDSIDDGEIGIFIINGAGYVKKYGGDRLISLNPSYDDIMINDYDTICCKGKVIGKLDKVDII